MLPRPFLTALGAAAVLGASGSADAQAPSRPAPREPADPVTLDLTGGLGGIYRAGDAQLLEVTERAGLTFGAGVLVAPSRYVAVGLAYEHADLGHERSGVGPFGSIEVERDLNSLWASLRVYLLPPGDLRLFLGLQAGLAWQSADATGALPFDAYATRSFACETSAPAGFAFGFGAGIEARLAGQLFLIGDLGFHAYRLTGDTLASESGLACAPGAGTVNAFALRAGLAYRWDISRLTR
jgi:hypothetical protein